jgi:type II secretory pathway predicted ATPase ExeA
VLPTIPDQLRSTQVQQINTACIHCNIIPAACITHQNVATAMCLLFATTPRWHRNVPITQTRRGVQTEQS